MAFGFQIREHKQFVVTCKQCRRDVPSGREEFPFQSITVECPLCGELRQYRKFPAKPSSGDQTISFGTG